MGLCESHYSDDFFDFLSIVVTVSTLPLAMKCNHFAANIHHPRAAGLLQNDE